MQIIIEHWHTDQKRVSNAMAATTTQRHAHLHTHNLKENEFCVCVIDVVNFLQKANQGSRKILVIMIRVMSRHKVINKGIGLAYYHYTIILLLNRAPDMK